MEQVFAEKLKSLLKHGIRSTRFRDLYDIYYLGHREDLDHKQLNSYIRILIIEDQGMRESDMSDIIKRIRRTLSDLGFLSNMKRSRKDWIEESVEEVTEWLPKFLELLKK